MSEHSAPLWSENKIGGIVLVGKEDANLFGQENQITIVLVAKQIRTPPFSLKMSKMEVIDPIIHFPDKKWRNQNREKIVRD